jgi:hypothetical protein
MKLSASLRPYRYLECSAVTGKNLKKVFEVAIELARNAVNTRNAMKIPDLYADRPRNKDKEKGKDNEKEKEKEKEHKATKSDQNKKHEVYPSSSSSSSSSSSCFPSFLFSAFRRKLRNGRTQIRERVPRTQPRRRMVLTPSRTKAEKRNARIFFSLDLYIILYIQYYSLQEALRKQAHLVVVLMICIHQCKPRILFGLFLSQQVVAVSNMLQTQLCVVFEEELLELAPAGT